MMWDSRSWSRILVESGQYSITYEFVSTHNFYTWYLNEVYQLRTICDGPWITYGDFNTNRTMEERR